MYATKRKFDRLITSFPSGNESTESVAKKPRVLPNYAPWDRGQFLERLKTFRYVDKWTAKDPRVNEVQWAKRGWRCISKERVGCVGGCGREVVLSQRKEKALSDDDDDDDGRELEEDWVATTDEQMIGRYETMIVTAHEETCLWRSRGCDDAIYRLPLNQRFAATVALRERYKSLITISKSLPDLISYPSTEDNDYLIEHPPAVLTATVSKNAGTTESVQNTVGDAEATLEKTPFVLSLFGWQRAEGHTSDLVTCTACFRRLGLWLFRTTPDDHEETSISRLDVIAEHREYCPWVNADSQSGPADKSGQPQKAGWEILVRTLTSDRRKEIDAASVGEVDDEEKRVERDKESWARLRKLKKVFEVRRKSGSKAAQGKPAK